MSGGRVAVWLAVIAVAGCAKETEGGAKRGSASVGSGTGTRTGSGTGGAVALSPECVELGGVVLGAVLPATRAMSGNLDGAVTSWRELRADCRGGAWYQAGAMLIRAGVAAPLAIDAVSLESATAAVAQGLAVAPGDLGLLSYAAYLHGVDDGPLPAEACDRASASQVPEGKAAVVRAHRDQVAYVCGAVALEASDWARALEQYGAVVDPPYPDVGVRQVEATVGARQPGDAGTLIADAAAMIERHRSRPGVTETDVATLGAQLSAAVRAPQHPREVSDKHMTFDDDRDAGSIPIDHTELLWGDYLDKAGKPSLGWHSHEPAKGNAK